MFKVKSAIDGLSDTRKLLIVREHFGQDAIVQPFVFKAVGPNELRAATMESDGDEFLQACLDHAWAVGLRTVGFSDTTNQVKAMDNHLQDMRALVFKRAKP